MSFLMAEVGGVYVFIADDEVAVLSADSDTLEAKPMLPVYVDMPVGFDEISPLR